MGSAIAFSRLVAGRELTFRPGVNGIVDTQTGAVWSPGGVGPEGALAGEQLRQVPQGNHFWFAWVLFWPDTAIRDSLDNLADAPFG